MINTKVVWRGLIGWIVLISTGGVHAQEVGKDVKPDHWAYEAIQDLAKKGLIKGYPPDGNFLGNRTLTRYEMASILKRVIDRMDDLLKALPPPGASKEDLARLKEDQDKLRSSLEEISRMVSEFKTQLTVIGTDMEQVKKDLLALRDQVSALGMKVDGFDARINSLTSKVDKANMAVDRALSSINELKTATSAALAKKVDVGTGKLRVGGLFQVWYGNAFGDSLGGNRPGTPVSPGRNFGGGVGDTFRIRRGYITFDGAITPRVDYHAILDIAKTGTGGSSVLQDLWVGFQLNREFRLEIGQQKTGLSEEGQRSSAELLTVANAIMNEDLPANSGRVGNIRDTGAVLRFKAKSVDAFLGIWNDNGATQSVVDNDRLKFLDGGIYVHTFRHFTFGIWGGTNVGQASPREARDRFGGTLIFQQGPHYFETEAAYSRDYAAGAPAPGKSGSISEGIYFLYAHSLSRQWQLVARYDEWDPAQNDKANSTTEGGVFIPEGDHKMKEYTFGINYYIRAHNAKIQLNYIRDDVEVNGPSFFGKSRSILLTNFQIAF